MAFSTWDGSGIKIEEHYMNYYLDDMLLNEINFDDVLISILITIAPGVLFCIMLWSWAANQWRP